MIFDNKKIKTKLLMGFLIISLLTGVFFMSLLIIMIEPLQDFGRNFETDALIPEELNVLAADMTAVLQEYIFYGEENHKTEFRAMAREAQEGLGNYKKYLTREKNAEQAIVFEKHFSNLTGLGEELFLLREESSGGSSTAALLEQEKKIRLASISLRDDLETEIGKNRKNLSRVFPKIKNMLTTGVIGILSLLTYYFTMVAGFGYLISLSLSRRLEEVRDAAIEFARGNEEVMLVSESKDEIGELAYAFNGMVEDVKKSHLALKEAKSVLEVKVKARTRELEELALGLEKRVEDRTKKLKEKIKELERFQKLAVGRELKMIELKKELKEIRGEK